MILRDLMGGINCFNFGNGDVKLFIIVMEYIIIICYLFCIFSG